MVIKGKASEANEARYLFYPPPVSHGLILVAAKTITGIDREPGDKPPVISCLNLYTEFIALHNVSCSRFRSQSRVNTEHKSQQSQSRT